MDKLWNEIKNKINETPRWSSQNNYLNLESTIDDVKIVGPVRCMWEGNMHGEKHMQIGKSELTFQRGDNHREILTKKIHTKNIKQIK